MQGLSSGTGRFAPAKIDVTCKCGKRYRVDATKAGKKLRCKKCRSRILVPGGAEPGQISMRSRKAILEELGIDPDVQTEAPQKKSGYTCSGCGTTLDPSILKDSYGPKGLACDECRSDEGGEKKKSKEEQQLQSWTRGRTTSSAARNKSLAMGALIGVGAAGFVNTFFGPPAWAAALVGVCFAVFGGRTIYTHEIADA